MKRIFILLFFHVLLFAVMQSKPLMKKRVKKKATTSIPAPELTKDTIAGFTDEQNAAFRAKLDKANGLIYNNTTYNYINGKASVKVGNWQEAAGKRIRRISFYDKKGIQTFELTDEMASYFLLTYIHFREDGSVDRAEVHENPGASMYSYLITIRFTENNIPVSRYKSRNPPDLTRDMTGSGKVIPVDTWDVNTHTWISPEPPKIKGMHYENGIYINDNFVMPQK